MTAQERLTALQAAQQGDAQALGLLLNSFRPYIRVIVHAFQGQRIKARVDDSDLVQDALLEVHRSIVSFQGASVEELAAWLRQIVVRTTGRTLRSFVDTGKRDPEREQPAAGLAGQLADSGSSPSAQAIRNEEAALMAEALAGLPDDMQQVLIGRHMDGLSHAAIAQRLNRTEQAVRMLYLRALRRLRELYRG